MVEDKRCPFGGMFAESYARFSHLLTRQPTTYWTKDGREPTFVVDDGDVRRRTDNVMVELDIFSSYIESVKERRSQQG